MRVLAFLAVFVAASSSVFAQSEKVVEVGSRGQKIRALLIVPANPAGSVILLAGGHGKLDITPQGAIKELAKNQLVRTRAAYAKAGFAVMVPDIAPDFKTPSGVVQRYRASSAYAQDLGAAVQYMRKVKNPVVMIGTSRGTLSVADALGHLKDKTMRPDAAVLTSGFLASTTSQGFQVRKLVHDNPALMNLPTLIVHHRKDGCDKTSPANVAPFKVWYEKNGRKLDVIWMDGGLPPKSKPCNARAPHGFYGLDDQVVGKIAAWIKAQRLSAQ
ncbi:MAG TPA: alpha/beta hydrolase [Xanthobacteraceae bacterium]|nr:alpha/beta hydrolase [Xanthobacteraceae bacterium]